MKTSSFSGLAIILLIGLSGTQLILLHALDSNAYEIELLVYDVTEKIQTLERADGDITNYLSELNDILETVNIYRNQPDLSQDDNHIIESLETMSNSIDDDILQAEQRNRVEFNNLVLQRMMILAAILVIGVYLLVNPPNFIIGLDWFGEIDES